MARYRTQEERDRWRRKYAKPNPVTTPAPNLEPIDPDTALAVNGLLDTANKALREAIDTLRDAGVPYADTVRDAIYRAQASLLKCDARDLRVTVPPPPLKKT